MKLNQRIPLLILISLILILSSQAQEELYQQDALELELEVRGNFELSSKHPDAKVQDVRVELLLYPYEEFRQKSTNLQTEGKQGDNKVTYEWNDGKFGTKLFGYINSVRTMNTRKKVKLKVPFPLKNVAGFEDYLKPTKTIDSDNAKIVAQASKLVEGEDDLFKAMFNLASWVEENVEYDLNTLTASSSQKASWVLDNKNGVCDEMTALFVAMARSIGVPARFVSGISYSNSALFSYPWQPHGWAEVYFPEIGWVSFDITFNQYGYVDVTHIKLREGFDPTEPASKYEWTATADKVDVKPNELDFSVKIKKEGTIVPEEILIEEELISKKVGFNSYNLVKGIIKNTADYYVATALNLAVPKEIDVVGRNRRNILLMPKEVRETFWIVKVPNNLNDNFKYTFPALIYSEKNISVKEEFIVQNGEKTYSKREIEKLTIKDEEKSYSRKIRFTCNNPEVIDLNELGTFSCVLKNVGNANLENIKFCLGDLCNIVNLPINQEHKQEVKIRGIEVGWNKIVVSAVNNLVEKKDDISYKVLDSPSVITSVTVPKKVNYGETLKIVFNLEKNSFQIPKGVVVVVKGPGFTQNWNVSSLDQEKKLAIELEDFPFQNKNVFKITTSWKDSDLKEYSESKEIVILSEGRSFADKVAMFLNGILNMFS